MCSVILFSALIAVCYGAAVISTPDEIDWNALGKVTPVVDQMKFNHSSEIYSAVGALESRQAIETTGDLVALSIQQIVDCSVLPPYGKMEEVYKKINETGGLDVASLYPEVGGKNEDCRFSADNVGAYVNYDSKVLPEGDEDALKVAVAQGPVAVKIDASQPSFASYKGDTYVNDIYYEPNCTRGLLNHDALVVGYGGEGDKAFWLVRNTWSEVWGLKGYIKMARNRDNNCNIASHAVYPILTGHEH